MMKNIPKTVQETESLYSRILSANGYIVIESVMELEIGKRITLNTYVNNRSIPTSPQEFTVIAKTDLTDYGDSNKKFYPSEYWEKVLKSREKLNLNYYRVITD